MNPVSQSHIGVAAVRELETLDVHKVLIYLLSSGHAENIAGLPLLSEISGDRVFLVRTTTSSARSSRTLLDGKQGALFKALDSTAIDLVQLPAEAANVLRNTGPGILNVVKLNSRHIIEYLKKFSSSPLFDGPADNRSVWLYDFWGWLIDSPLKTDVIRAPEFVGLSILPCEDGIHSVRDGVFDGHIALPELVEALRSLSVKFVGRAFTRSAATWLLAERKLQNPDNAVVILDNVVVDHPVDLGECAVVLRDHLEAGLAHVSKPTEKRVLTLGRLPIHDLAISSDTGVIPTTGPLPSVRVLFDIGDYDGLLPTIDDYAYVRNLTANIGRHLSKTFQVEQKAHNTDIILELAVKHFASQSKHLQASFLELILERQSFLTPDVIRQLKETPFVLPADGTTLRAPAELIDPECQMAIKLLDRDDSRLPKATSAEDSRIAGALHNLGLLMSDLSLAIVQEKINWIIDTSHPERVRHDRALALLTYIKENKFSCTGLQIKDTDAWLPADDGSLRCTSDCFSTRKRNPHLFDRVVPTFSVEVSSSLRRSVGLDRPIPLDILIRQLKCCLDEPDERDQWQLLVDIIEELGKRNAKIGSTDIECLIETTLPHAWIPVDSQALVKTSYACFHDNLAVGHGLPFHVVHTPLSRVSSIKSFLTRMGCNEECV